MNQKPLPRLKRDVLGTVALALLPIQKMKIKSPRGIAFEHEFHDFLLSHFNGYTVSSGAISGHWKDDSGKDHYGEHREYRVALPDEASVGIFESFLSKLARELDEECIYTEHGSQISLVYRLAS